MSDIPWSQRASGAKVPEIRKAPALQGRAPEPLAAARWSYG